MYYTSAAGGESWGASSIGKRNSHLLVPALGMFTDIFEVI
jgi:hypothetical protein